MRWCDFESFLASIEGDKQGTTNVYLDSFRKSDYPVDGGLRLGTALQGCEKLESIQNLNLEALFPPLSSESESIDKAAPLLQVIRESKHLRRVSFRSLVGDHNRALSLLFCQAMASNTSLKDVDFQSPFPGDAFCHLVRATQSIRTLHHQDLLFIPQGLGGALTANTSLRNIRVGGLDNEETSLHVLRELELHTNLEDLALVGSNSTGAEISAVGRVLQSRTLPLKSLRLELFKFVERMIEPLSIGLRLSTSLTSLNFSSCEFNKQATADLVEFMNSESTGRLQTLQELTLNRGSFGKEIFHNEPTDQVVARMLIPPERATGPTIGSRLSVLHIRGFADRHQNNAMVFTNLFAALGAHASRIHLEELFLDNIHVSSIPALIDCLPCLIHLKSIRVIECVGGVDSPGILRALRQNGSLHTFSYRGAFSGDQVRMIESYCMRNERLLPKTIAKLGCSDDENNTEAATVPSEVLLDLFKASILSWELLTDLFPVAIVPLEILPELLCAATQAPRFAPTNVLAGLVALDDLCPSSDTKRLCQTSPKI